MESALGLANQPGTRVILSYRKEEFGRVKPRNVEKLEAAVAAGKIDLKLKSQLRQIHPDRVELDDDGNLVSLENDVVIIRIGGEPPAKFLAQLGIETVVKEIPIAEAQEAVVG